ncbi:gem-associated protein 8-like [Leptopilina heterotoma]|uniref:gem-associated protein 8-like n=1 Tax=Leptopilina heterotoma TaxID=63436 RepID=UPI001CA8373F|nr:gem-associated protein 8-like [Leptopilina heterotoma]
MESISIPRKRFRNRRKRRQVRKNKQFDREKLRFEVRSRERQKFIAGASVYLPITNPVNPANRHNIEKSEKSMEAKAFWENYSTAQEWQQTHNVAWWKSRCIALEAENETLREMIQKIVKSMQCQCGNARQINNLFLSSINQQPKHSEKIHQQHYENKNIQKQKNRKNYQNYEEISNEHNLENEIQSDDENFEFHVNEGMMDFLKQSIKHKMELKQSREEKEALERNEEDAFPKMRTISLKERIENAKLLYGESSPRILGMETALQATIDSHKDRTRPNYWPNIPLKL